MLCDAHVTNMQRGSSTLCIGGKPGIRPPPPPDGGISICIRTTSATSRKGTSQQPALRQCVLPAGRVVWRSNASHRRRFLSTPVFDDYSSRPPRKSSQHILNNKPSSAPGRAPGSKLASAPDGCCRVRDSLHDSRCSRQTSWPCRALARTRRAPPLPALRGPPVRHRFDYFLAICSWVEPCGV